jgi:hypothetical protein
VDDGGKGSKEQQQLIKDHCTRMHGNSKTERQEIAMGSALSPSPHVAWAAERSLLWGLGGLQEQTHTHIALLCNDGTFSRTHAHTSDLHLDPLSHSLSLSLGSS